MSEFEEPNADPPRSTLLVAHVVYALHAFAIGLGIVGTPTVIGGFVGSLPSIIAVILSYAKRASAHDTWAASHFRWQIRTFWFALLWLLIGLVLILTVLGAPVGLGVLLIVTVWLVYRVGRGWLRLRDERPMYV